VVSLNNTTPNPVETLNPVESNCFALEKAMVQERG